MNVDVQSYVLHIWLFKTNIEQKYKIEHQYWYLKKADPDFCE